MTPDYYPAAQPSLRFWQTPRAVALSPDGRYLAACVDRAFSEQFRTLTVFSADGQSRLWQRKIYRFPDLHFSADGMMLIAVEEARFEDAKHLLLFSSAEGRLMGSWRVAGQANVLPIPDNSGLALWQGRSIECLDWEANPLSSFELEAGSRITAVAFSATAKVVVVAQGIWLPNPVLGFAESRILLCSREGAVLNTISTDRRWIKQLHVARRPTDDHDGWAVSTVSAPARSSHELLRFNLEEPGVQFEDAGPQITLKKITNGGKNIFLASQVAMKSLVIREHVSMEGISCEWIWDRRIVREMANRHAVVSADGHQIVAYSASAPSSAPSLDVLKSVAAFFRDEANAVLDAAEVLANSDPDSTNQRLQAKIRILRSIVYEHLCQAARNKARAAGMVDPAFGTQEMLRYDPDHQERQRQNRLCVIL
jgi:hypothetical protein